MQIIIIGAGVLGASTAFHLAREGQSVTVVDAALDGRATAAGAGIICPWVSGVEDAAFYRLYAAGGEYYPELIEALRDAGESDTGYRRAGAMLVSADPPELAWLERMVRRRDSAAIGAISRLDPAAARAAFPPLRPDLGAVHVAGGGRVDGRRLTACLLRAAQRLGATIRQGHGVPRIEGGHVSGVAIDGAPVPADCVIVTTGAWGDDVLRPAGLRLPVAPQRGQIVHLRLPQVQTADWPVILPPGSHYIVPFEGGRVVAGATRESGAGFDYRVTAGGQHTVLTEALAIAPGLADATVLETRIGFRPAGGLRPILGWAPAMQGLAIGNGLGAAGLTIGPFAGRLLAELVIGQGPELDLQPFSPEQAAASMHDDVPPLR